MPTSDRKTTKLIAKIVTKIEEFFNGTLGTWKIDPVYL